MWIDKINKNRDKELEKCSKEQKKEIKEAYKKKTNMIVLFAVLIHIGLLVILKYTGFFGENINNLLALFNTDFRFKIPKICIPIGISFYTLQGLSYNFSAVSLYLHIGPSIIQGKKAINKASLLKLSSAFIFPL